jgi:glycine cleavage system regulatory protein
MQRALVMTIIGEDRPGLVESVAAIVAEHGGNWLASRMSRLGGQFAGILRVEAPTDRESALRLALKQLEKQGLTIVVQPDKALTPTPTPARLSSLDIVGHDRPGIVRQISRILAQYGVNVEELETECDSAPMSGEVLFKAHAKLGIPSGCNTAALREDLEQIAADLIVEISLAELPQA